MRTIRRAPRGEIQKPTRFGEEFRMIAEAMPQLVWTARADGTIDYFNRRWIDYTGIDLKEFERRGEVVGVVHPDEVEETWARWRAALESGEPYEQEYRLRRANDGSYRWFLCRAVPIVAGDGSVSRWIGTATDIDDRQRARDNLHFMVEVANALSISKDIEAICKALARAAVRCVADWCFVTLAQDGRITTHAIEHKNKDLQHYLEQYRDRYPPQPGDALTEVIRRNEPLLIERVMPGQIEAAARDPEHLRLLKLLQMHSVILVPLATPEGRVYGAVSLVSSESGRLFSEAEVNVTRTVGCRVAAAIQNVRIHEDEKRDAERLRFTARISQLLFETPDPWQAMEGVARMIATEVADACAILRLDDDKVRTEIITHRDPKVDATISGLRRHRTMRLHPESELAARLKQHETLVLSDDSIRMKERAWPYLASEIEALNVKSTVVVPWHSGTVTHGALVAHYSAEGAGRRDVALLEEVAHRASVALERAETLERERRIATTLQQASLPSLIPRPKDLRFDAVYAPAGDEADVGGDWYDAIELDDGSVVVSVGDVTGRGIQAAAIMSKVRHAMGMAPLHEPDPTKILDSAGWFLGKRYPDAIVTAFVAIISSDRRIMRFANAGHPLPILRRNGELIDLCASGLPLGLRHLSPPEESSTIELCDGDILLLFTDGLIEGRREWAIGEALLRGVLTSDLFAATTAPAKLVARCCLPAQVHDDVAILAVSVRGPRAWNLSLDDARAAVDARSHFVEFLHGIKSDRNFIDTAELVFGELLSNVVRHAPGPVEISIDLNDDSMVLHVIDSGPPLVVAERRLPEDVLSERGRGLFIVQQLALDVRVEHIVNCGNHISVTMSRPH